MNHPTSHDRMPPTWRDRWNPYRHREYIGHVMSPDHFEMLLACDAQGRALHSVDYEGHGCLDAPEEIPCGSTLSIKTIGGWWREEYNKQPRYVTDWKAQVRAEAETAQMIKGILEEVE